MSEETIHVGKIEADAVLALLDAMGIVDAKSVHSCKLTINPPGLVEVEVGRYLRNPEGKFYRDPDDRTEAASERRVASIIWPWNKSEA